MFSRIHQKLGTAGFIISIMALVAALGGGAYAASNGLNSKQKKEVKSIAKTEAQKFATAGPQGSAGSTGPAGAKGDAGSSGAAGKSVVVTTEPNGANCQEGGTKVEVEGNAASQKFVCNGEEGAEGAPGSTGPEGSPWVVGGVPTGSLMKGTWAVNANAATANQIVVAAVTTGVPLKGSIGGVFYDGTVLGEILECPESGTVNAPLPAVVPATAQPPRVPGAPVNGAVCVYLREEGEAVNLKDPTEFLEGEGNVGQSRGGAVFKLRALAAGPVTAFGSWAMTAP